MTVRPDTGTGPALAELRDADATARRAATWTRHWAGGAAHSCAGSFGERYGGAIAAFWRQVAQDLPDGAKVLDLATGNGAVPRLLLDATGSRAVTIDAIDLAEVEPAWRATLPHERQARLRFHGGQRAEVLPFADACFTLVTSQYGLEYTDLSRSVPELLRVLATGGRAALVMHHAASRPVSLARVELGHLDWLRSPQGLLPTARAMLPLLARARTAEGRLALQRDAQAEACRVAFNDAQDMLRRRATEVDGADVLAEMHDAMNAALQRALDGGLAQAEAAWQAAADALQDSQLRLQELVAHALDDDALAGLLAMLARAGLQELQLGTLAERGHLMGWSLTLTRRR